MPDALAALATLIQTLRTVLFAGGVAVAAIAAVDWGVRTRRINPFNGAARFMRARVDPRLVGIERQVMRAGGHQSATPWWALLAYVVLAMLLLAGVELVAGLLTEAIDATQNGPAGMLLLVVHWTFAFLRIALLVRVIGSWFPRLASSRWAAWSYPATEWLLRPLRGLLPTFGVVDLSPIVAWFGLQIVEWLVLSVLRGGMR